MFSRCFFNAPERNDNMNDNFKCIYKILKTLEKALDYESISLEEIGYEHLKISEIRWIHYLEMMSDVGLINGIEFKTYVDGSTEVINNGVRITLKGLEYLTENIIMKRMYKAAETAKNIIK